MSAPIPESHADLLDKKAFAHLATLMRDGSRQSTPVWFAYDGTHVIVNSAKGRQKDRNMRRDPRVSLSISDPDDPYRYLERRGRVVEITEEGADDSIDAREAHRLGLVNHIVPDGAERDEAERLARRIASRAPVAVQLHKVMIDAAQQSSLDAALSFETEALVQTAMTRDNLEGTKAFFEKREPDFRGE